MKRILFLFASLFALFAFSTPIVAQEEGGDDEGQVVDNITDGYYYIYTISGANERGMYINNTSFCWENLERGNARFIFRLVSNGEENQFYMQNLYEGSWWGDIVNYYVSNFDKTEETRRAMYFAPNGDGTFKVRPVNWRTDKSTEADWIAHDNFATDGGGRNWSSVGNQSGPYGVWHDLGQWVGANWLVEKVTDADLQAAQLNTKLIDALSVYTNANMFTQSTDKLITNVDGDADPASGEPSQFLTNCQRTNDASSSFAHLIDGDLGTYFQSTWSDVPMPQWIQVDVSADGNDKQIEGFQLQLGLRRGEWGSDEQPSDIAVFATNDETAAKDLDACTIEDALDNSAWTKIGDFQMPLDQALYYDNSRNNIIQPSVPTPWLRIVNGANAQADRYVTKNILLNGDKYRYIRFYIYNTAINASDNHDFTLGEFQMYELTGVQANPVAQTEVTTLRDLIKADYAKVKARTATADDLTALEAAMLAVSSKSSAALTALQALVDSINSAGAGLNRGTEPGYNDTTKVAEYDAAYAAAVNGTHSALTDAQYTELANNLRAALVAAQASVIPVSDGYYNIINAYPNFYETVAITGLPTQKILGWQVYNINNPAQLFKITQLGDGQYSIQNVQTGKYIGTIAGTSQEPRVTDAQEVAQTITPISGSPGQFNLANAENDIAYHAEFHQSGANVKGYVCTWNGGASSCSAWRLSAVTGAKLDSLLAVAPVANRQAIAAHEIDSARAAYDKTFAYKQSAYLITNCDDTDPDNCQWWSTCQEPSANYSSYAHLIDGNLGTVFQSTWNSSTHEKPQWIQADLQDNPVKDFSLYYGLRNGTWGAWEQWTQITIFATNDESVAKDENIDTYEQISASDSWKNFGSFDLPDENAIRNYSGSGRSFVYDINNIFDQKYRFIRFYATHTYKKGPSAGNDLGEFTIGELNIMENTYDEASAPYYYVEGLKTAADNLKAQENTVRAAIADGSITQEQIDQLIALRKAVLTLTPDKAPLQALYNTDNTYVSKFAAGEEYGDVTDAEWTAVQTALSNAKAVLDADQPSAAELNAQIEALNAAMPTFRAAQIQFEPNKWYYIVSRCTTRNGSIEKNGEGETAGIAHDNSIYSTFIYGNVAYAASDNTHAAQGSWGTNNNNTLKWGYYVAGQEKGGAGGDALYSNNLDPHTMWRLIPIEGKDGQYAIQNRATGRFWGTYSGNSWQQLGTDTVAFVFENLGSGVYKFRAASASVYMQLAGDGYVYSYNADLDDPNGQVSFTLEPVETAENVVMEYPYDNSIFIKSLPYAIDATAVSTNAGYVDIYGVKGLEVVDGDSTLLLEKKTSVEAGEPFIGIAGDYEAFDPENATTTTLVLPAADAFSFEAKTVNGLTAALDYTRPNKPGLGYFVNSVLTATEAGTGIEGHTGYFDVKDMPVFTTTTEAPVRIKLTGKGVTAIKGITTGKDGVVNVYSIDGKLIKKNVNSSKAGKGLSKGIYIVGKKKVAVK